jgi:hypothetical protein
VVIVLFPRRHPQPDAVLLESCVHERPQMRAAHIWPARGSQRTPPANWP